jgi:DNA (cytosine-5)-methyltransferase 1
VTKQQGFAFRHVVGRSLLRAGEIVVDLFAGGGGASEALRQALGRDPDIAINHDEWAIGMHSANHPYTRHMCEDVWTADPRHEVGARRVGWLHASPDCTHFSQAKGGQPRSRVTRSLSWVVLKWAGTVGPRILSLENVEQILKWGPLIAKRDRATGRVMRLDGTVAEPGERVPVHEQFLVPDPRRAGQTWRHFVAALRAIGYVVEWRKLRASDFGAGTSRTRLFMLARRDGEPIRWPSPTHGPGLEPVVTAADCIDWSIPCPSIFTRKKSLADATLRRVARGIKRYVLDAAEPFIVGCGGRQGQSPERAVGDPMQTITAKADSCIVAPTLVQACHGDGEGTTKRRGGGTHHVESALGTIDAKGGTFGLCAATLVQTGYGERVGQTPRVPGLDKPLGTLVDGVKHAAVAAHLVKFRGDSSGSAADTPLPTITSGAGAARPAGAAHALGIVTAYLEQANTGLIGHDAREPLSTIVGKGCTQRVVAANMIKLRGTSTAADADEPLHTISAGGEHHAVVECTLSREHEQSALRVAAFLIRYYGEGGQWGDLRAPADTITTRDRLALVTVIISGTPYVIVDIGLRMLKPPELYRAQGFPLDYVIDRTADGRPITGTKAVRMVGNSVSPPPLRAIALANLDPSEFEQREAA